MQPPHLVPRPIQSTHLGLQHVSLLGVSHRDVLLTPLLGLFAFICSMVFLLRSPESLVSAIVPAPIQRTLADLSMSQPMPPPTFDAVAAAHAAAAAAQAAAGHADTAAEAEAILTAAAAATAAQSVPTWPTEYYDPAFLSNTTYTATPGLPLPPQVHYVVAATLLSLFVAAIASSLYLPLYRVARLYLQLSRPQLVGTIATAQPGLTRAMSHILIVGPILSLVLLMPVSHALLSTWLGVTVGTALGVAIAAVLLLAAVQLCQARAMLCTHFNESRTRQTTHLVSSVIVALDNVCGQGAHATKPALSDIALGNSGAVVPGVPLSADGVKVIAKQCAVEAVRTVQESGLVSYQVLYAPLLVAVLAALALRRGQWVHAATSAAHAALASSPMGAWLRDPLSGQGWEADGAAALANSPLAGWLPEGEEAVTMLSRFNQVDQPAKMASLFTTLLGPDVVALPPFRLLFDGRHATAVLLYVLTCVIAAITAYLALLVPFHEYLWRFVTSVAAGRAAAAADAATTAAVGGGAARGGGRGNSKKDK